MPNQNNAFELVRNQNSRQINHKSFTKAAYNNTYNNMNNQEKKLKILICTESFHPYTSGIARRFKEIIIRLCKRGYLIHVVTGCKGCETLTDDPDIIDNVSFSSLYSIEFKNKIDCALPFLLPQYGMLKAILNFKPDIIHCVEHTPATTFIASLALSLNIPIVWSSHTNLDYYIPLYIYKFIAPLSLKVYQLLRKNYLNYADYNLTVSSDFVKLLNENGIKKKVYVWKTGVDSESFNPSYRSHEMRLKMFNGHYSPEKILLVSVGRLSPEKNFEFLLNILERFPQTFLCIVGGGPFKESLEPLFPKNQTHFMGFLQGEELAAAYASADYFIYASISETFGQVYLEAMSSGVPIVAAEGKQMKEFFINGIHGYTWKPNDIESACQALENVIKDRNLFSQNCRSNALNHSWNSAANQIEDVYDIVYKNKIQNKLYKNKKSFKILNFLSIVLSFFNYLSKWLVLMLLIVLFMLPFMKVSKPINKKEEKQTPKRRRSRKISVSSSSSSEEFERKASENCLIFDREITLNPDDKLKTNFNDLSTQTQMTSSDDDDLRLNNEKKMKRFKKKRNSKCNKLTNRSKSKDDCVTDVITKFFNKEQSSLDKINMDQNCYKLCVFYLIKKQFKNSTKSLSTFLTTLSAFFISILSITAFFAICLNINNLYLQNV